MSPLQRRKTVAGAFRVRGQARIAGKTIILVDDVLTTGSTADACARTLKARRRGARRADQLGARGASFAVDALMRDALPKYLRVRGCSCHR